MVVKKETLIPLALACVGLCFSIYYESRSFILGYTAALIFVWFVIRKFRSVLYEGMMGLGFFGLGAILALTMKTGSTNGRMLIYKVSANIFKDYYLTGIGFGNFKNHYLHYQTAYFKEGNYTDQELLLADNTYYAFNDYWQFVLEWGIFGGLILLIFGLLVFYIMFRVCFSDTKGSLVYRMATVFLVAITVAACFNHVFERFYIQIIFFISLSIIGWGFYKRYCGRRVLYFAFVLLGIFLLFFAEFGHKILSHKAYRLWHEGEILRRMGYVNKSLGSFEEAYPSLRMNGSFLVGYSEILMSAGRFGEAIEKFEEALSHRVNYSVYISLGLCYHKVGKYEKAEQAFLKTIYMVPNRFESRLALFDYYMETNKKKEAMYWGRSILNLPVKVPSQRVNLIKEDVVRHLAGHRAE